MTKKAFHFIHILVPFLLLLPFIISCKEEPVDVDINIKKEPVVTGETTDVKVVSAVINGTINIDTTTGGVFKIGVICSLEDEPTIDNGYIFEGNALKGNNFSVTTYNLPPSALVYYRAFIYTGGLYHYGDVKSFSTKDLSSKDLETSAIKEDDRSQVKICGLVY